MKKRTIMATVLSLVMATTGLAYADEAYPSIPVLVQGQTLGQALVIKGRAMVPIRDLENLGANVAWNNATKTATVNYNDRQAVLSEVNQDIAIINGASYAKLRSLEALGLSLDYQPANKRVLIDSHFKSSSTNTDINGVFVREALPPAFPNPVPDYRDDVRAGRVEVSIEQASNNFVGQYWEEDGSGPLPLLRIKAQYNNLYKGNWDQEVTTREIMLEFARVLRLSPNSDERNIPLDLRNKKGSPDYILWAKFGKTPMFKDLIKPDGNIGNQMDAPMKASILTKTVYLYYTEYMGVDLTQVPEFNRYASPIYPADLQKLSPEEAKIVLELRHIGITGQYNKDSVDDPYRINFGNVTIINLNDLMCDMLMGFVDTMS
mgnify:CR=1 FL=1